MYLKALILVSALAAMLLVIGGPVYGFDVPRLSVLVVTMGAALVAALPAAKDVFAGSPRWMRALLAAASAFVVWIVVLTALADESMLSVLGQDSRFVGAAALVAPVVLVWALPVALRTTGDIDRAMWLLTWLVAGAALYAVIQYLGLDPMPWTVGFRGRPVSFFGNSNFVGGVLCLGAPLAWWLWTGGRRWRGVAVASLVLVAVAIYAAQVRLGMVAAAVGLTVAVLYSFRWPWPGLQRRLLTVVPAGAVAVGFAVVAVGAAIGDVNGLARVRFWRVSALMVADSPLVGHGVGRFEPAYRLLRAPEHVVDELGRFDQRVDSTHSFLLDLAATSGLPAAILWLLVLGAAGLGLAWLWQRAEHASDYRRIVVLAGALAAHGVQSSISVPIITTVWLGWVLVGLVVAVALASEPVTPRRTSGARRPARSRRDGSPAARAVAIAVSAIVALGLAVPAANVFGATSSVGAAISLRSAGAPDAALTEVETAQGRAPWWPEPYREESHAWTDLGNHAEAARAAAQAIAVDPSDSQAYQLALMAAGNLGDLNLLRSIIDEMRLLDPSGVSVHLNALRIASEVGDEDLKARSIDVLDRALEPSDPLWADYAAIMESSFGVSPG